MCSPDDYAHILANEPSPEERAAMALIPAEPERRPRDVSGEPREWTRPAILVAADALDLPDCAPGCSCRGALR